MRINSPKQTEASRANGSNSRGPKSTRGKDRVRVNALRYGLFSKDIVIESAGERLEDFAVLKKRMWDFFSPRNPLEEMLVTDIVENSWRRRRVRHCETTELNNKFRAQEIRDRLERAKRLESLKHEFLVRFQDLLGTRAHGLGWDDNVQAQLASTSLGMDYLIGQMSGVKDQVRADGYLSKKSDAMMRACGIDIHTRVSCSMWSEMVEEFEQTPEGGDTEGSFSASQSQEDEGEGPSKRKKAKHYSGRSLGSKMLIEGVRGAIASQEDRKRALESVEQMEARTRAAEALLPVDSVDRFSRAETAFERRMYRALAALFALRGDAERGTKLPKLPE